MSTDNRETITVDLDHDVLFSALMMAHERDITFNQFMELILRQFIEEANETE